MPPRKKETKEPVVYPASKRKAPAFIPQRPAKGPRIVSEEMESSGLEMGAATTSAATSITAAPVRRVGSGIHGGFRKASRLGDGDSSEGAVGTVDGAGDTGGARRAMESEDESLEASEGGLDDDPLAGMRRGAISRAATVKKTAVTASKPTKNAPTKRVIRPPQPPRHEMEISSSPPSPDHRSAPAPPPLSQSAKIPMIPQPLLLRLLHESFADKSTRIDKHAIQVLQKYMEVFVRETIARAALAKREAAERGEVDEMDKAWLELEDLEKVAPGMLLEF